MHADQHAIAFAGNRLIAGCDGGIYFRDDRGSTSAGWTNRNTGLALTQFYHGAISFADKNLAIAGAQDNGSSKFNGTYRLELHRLRRRRRAAISRSRPNTDWAVSSQNLTIRKTTTGALDIRALTRSLLPA